VQISVFLLVTMFFTFVIESVLHFIEHRAHEKADKRIVQKIFKEMTLLGVISFTIFMVGSFQKLESEIELTFEVRQSGQLYRISRHPMRVASLWPSD
jgi:uncharacterized membrane protein YGL010W